MPKSQRTHDEEEDERDGRGNHDLRQEGSAERGVDGGREGTTGEHQQDQVEREKLSADEDQRRDHPPECGHNMILGGLQHSGCRLGLGPVGFGG